MAGSRGPHVPPWSWSYVTFRFGDGATNALVPLAVVIHYDLPLWSLAVTTAAMNLAGVPASFLWGSLIDRTRRRRALVVSGFLVAAAAMALLATLPSFPLFVAGAILFTFFGVASSPAASAMVLQGVPRGEWALATSRLSRRTGFAFLSGMTATIVIGLVAPPVPFEAVFAAAAVFVLSAAAMAWRTIPAAQPPLPHEHEFDPAVERASQRRFDRTVFFPARLRHLPTWRGLRSALRQPHRLWPIGYALTFAGSVSFFTSYPGVLHEHVGLTAGMVLLAQAPSHIVSPLAYTAAGRHGIRVGESRGVVQGVLMRMAAVPLLALLVLPGRSELLPLLMVLHAAMGLSFAFIQVNGPLILAGLHPRGRGQGVGTYHAAIGTGTLLGSLSAFLILRTVDTFAWSYIFSVGMTFIGGACIVVAHRRHQGQAPRAEPPSPQGPSSAPSVARP